MCVARDRAKVIAITNEGKADAKRAFNHRDIIALQWRYEAFNARLQQLARISRRRSQNAYDKNKKTNMNAFDIFHRTTTTSRTHCTADALDSIGSCPTASTPVSGIRYDSAEEHAITIVSLLIQTMSQPTFRPCCRDQPRRCCLPLPCPPHVLPFVHPPLKLHYIALHCITLHCST